MRQFPSRGLKSNSRRDIYFGKSRGSASKGLLVSIVVVAIGAAITFFLISPNGVSNPSGTGSDSGNLSPITDQIITNIPPTPNYSLVPETMLAIEYVISYTFGDKKLPSSQRISYLQAGDAYSRRESTPIYSLGRHELVLRNKSDQWIANLFTKSARHMNFAGTVMNKAYPIPTMGFEGALNFGEEVQFFVRNDAVQKVSGDEEGYFLSSDKSSLSLFVNRLSKAPVRLKYKGEGIVTEIEISKYDTSLKFDKDKFSLPKEVIPLEMSVNQTPIQFRRWIDEDPRILTYYKSPNPDLVIDILKEIKWVQSFNSRNYLGNFFGAILAKHPRIIKQVVQAAKGNDPEVQLMVAIALRWCRSEECLKELKTNPFGFADEGLQKFVELPERADQPGGRSLGPDGLVSQFLAEGDITSIEALLKFFDEQLALQDKNPTFLEHVKEYGRLLKRLSKDNEGLGALIADKSTTSKMAKLTLEVEDKSIEPMAGVPAPLPAASPLVIK